MAKSTKSAAAKPPIVVIYGDEEFQKHSALNEAVDEALPAGSDRGMSIAEYDADRRGDSDGLAFATVADDLGTLPFLAERRIVIIRNADAFITAHREKLEAYAARPSPTATLILCCRTFPATTRLSKAVAAGGGRIVECKKLKGQALVAFVQECAAGQRKKLDHPLAAKIVDLVGADQGALANEIDKLAIYTADRPTITATDISELVGQSREEIVFAALDTAAAGRLPQALAMWSQTLESDKAAAFKAVAGVAYKLRSLVTAHEMRAAGEDAGKVAAKVGLWGRVPEAQALLKRITSSRAKRLLAALAELDAQSKVGERSIEHGIEALLVELAA